MAGIGTGGTVSGVARYLKEQDPQVKVLAVDIAGSVFTDHWKFGRRVTPSRTLVEGLGDEEIIGCPEWERIDDMVQATDRDAILAARELARSEAIFAGGSSGATLWGVRQLAARLTAAEGAGTGAGAGTRIATLFADSGNRYLSTIYSDAWIARQGWSWGRLAAPSAATRANLASATTARRARPILAGGLLFHL